jgi:hydroxymethylglutaryl-CoA lyase
MNTLKITESPRDAIQGLPVFIPTQAKVAYINTLLKVGFDIIDFGSFVSPKTIPQLGDTGEVVKQLDLTGSSSELMVITGNVKGAEVACRFEAITWLSFPFSVSETFLKLNINAGFDKGRLLIDNILKLCDQNHKSLMVYLTMAFGNPYGDKWDPEMVWRWTEKLMAAGVSHFALSDITGEATPENIALIYSVLKSDFPGRSFALHLHTTADSWHEKVDAAWQNGCRHFDAVINGYGGCPMTGYEMLGNLNTALLVEYADNHSIDLKIDRKAFHEATLKALPFYNSGANLH